MTKPFPTTDCAYMERRRSETAAAEMERYRRSIDALLPLVEPQPVVLEYRSASVDEAHGYGFHPQAFYREGMLVGVSSNALSLGGLELGWDGTIIRASATPTDLIARTTRVFVRQGVEPR